MSHFEKYDDLIFEGIFNCHLQYLIVIDLLLLYVLLALLVNRIYFLPVPFTFHQLFLIFVLLLFIFVFLPFIFVLRDLLITKHSEATIEIEPHLMDGFLVGDEVKSVIKDDKFAELLHDGAERVAAEGELELIGNGEVFADVVEE